MNRTEISAIQLAALEVEKSLSNLTHCYFAAGLIELSKETQGIRDMIRDRKEAILQIQFQAMKAESPNPYRQERE